MTPQERKVMELALEALERLDGWLALRYGSGLTPEEKQTVTAIKEALQSSEQVKPVARKESNGDSWDDRYGTGGSYGAGGCYGSSAGFTDGDPNDGY